MAEAHVPGSRAARGMAPRRRSLQAGVPAEIIAGLATVVVHASLFGLALAWPSAPRTEPSRASIVVTRLELPGDTLVWNPSASTMAGDRDGTSTRDEALEHAAAAADVNALQAADSGKQQRRVLADRADARAESHAEALRANDDDPREDALPVAEDERHAVTLPANDDDRADALPTSADTLRADAPRGNDDALGEEAVPGNERADAALGTGAARHHVSAEVGFRRAGDGGKAADRGHLNMQWYGSEIKRIVEAELDRDRVPGTRHHDTFEFEIEVLPNGRLAWLYPDDYGFANVIRSTLGRLRRRAVLRRILRASQSFPPHPAGFPRQRFVLGLTVNFRTPGRK